MCCIATLLVTVCTEFHTLGRIKRKRKGANRGQRLCGLPSCDVATCFHSRDPWNGRHVLALMVRLLRTSRRCLVALHQRSAKSTWLWLSRWTKLTCRLFGTVKGTVARTAKGGPMTLPILVETDGARDQRHPGTDWCLVRATSSPGPVVGQSYGVHEVAGCFGFRHTIPE